jgi:hypothetical protein
MASEQFDGRLVLNVVFYDLGVYTCFRCTWQPKTEFTVRLTQGVSAIDALYQYYAELPDRIKY